MTAAPAPSYTGGLLPNHTHARGVLTEGAASGILGALAVALWFLLRDLIEGRPFHTPSALGHGLTALLKGGVALGAVPDAPFSSSMMYIYTVAHGIIFIAAGAACSFLLNYARRNPGQELYAVLVLATLGMWFTFLSMMLVGVVLSAVTIVDILIAHLLATLAMGAYFWRRHPEVWRGL
ncbi:MAG: hypothetical protein AABZ64_10415 [Nitrospinota bacterium]